MGHFEEGDKNEKWEQRMQTMTNRGPRNIGKQRKPIKQKK